MSCDEIRFDLPLLAVGEASGGATAAIEDHLETCETCRDEFTAFRHTIATLQSHASEPPPAEVRRTVLATVEAAKLGPLLEYLVEPPRSALKDSVMAAAQSDSDKRPHRASVIPMRPRPERLVRILAAAAVVAAAFAVGTIADLGGGKSRPSADGSKVPPGHETQVLALEGMGPTTAHVRHYRHDNFRITYSVEGFEPTPTGFHYAVWVRGEPGDVAVGTFRLKRPDDFEIPFAVGVNPTEYPRFVVTLEPNDGDPTLNGQEITTGRFDPRTVHHGDYND